MYIAATNSVIYVAVINILLKREYILLPDKNNSPVTALRMKELSPPRYLRILLRLIALGIHESHVEALEMDNQMQIGD